MRPSIILIMLSLIVIAACAGKATPTPKATFSPEVQPQKPLKAAWKEDWEKTIKAAKSEGKLVIYSGSNPEMREAQRKVFQERFGITLEAVPGTAGQLAAKILTEYRANIFAVDIYAGGSATTLLTLKPSGVLSPLDPILVLPEVLDPKVWYGGKIPFVDEAHTTAIISLAPGGIFVINTSLVQPGEINSYQDLLNSKWKRKIILNNPTRPPGGDIWFTAYVHNKALSLDYMRALARQEPFISDDRRLAAEWLSRGKYPISIGTGWAHFEEFYKAGLPVKQVTPVEGDFLTAGAGTIALMKNTPHPNAARAFINWVLSKEGATITSIGYDKQSTRLDVPTEGLSEFRLRQPGIKYIPGETEELYLERPKYREIAREIFGNLLPR